MDYLIKNYIQNITITDFDNLLKSKGINTNDNDLHTLFYYLKNKWEDLYKGNSTEIINELEEKLESNTFIKLKKLYLEYKNKF
ncbi:MAG: hypothetical protein RSE91_00440 [Bacilli bacterium]